MRFSKSTAAALAAIPLATAQTFTDCNPMKKSCPNDAGMNSDAFASDFTKDHGSAASWSIAEWSNVEYGGQGAQFAISAAKQAPTIETDFYIFFGRVDVKMRAAPGTGIVSSIVFESQDLDEIDWEFVGGDTAQVQSNFFGKGNTTSYDRVQYIPVSTPQDTLHTYTVDWTSERIQWLIDGKLVRTLSADDPLTVGGYNYPQTPMKIKLGSWCGGCEGQPQGTVEWAGGRTTFEGAPYTMYVESVNIANYNPADEYQWGDKSGSWQSINCINGGSSSNPEGSGSDDDASTTVTDTAPTKSHSVENVDSTAASVPTGGSDQHGGNGSYTMKTTVATATKTNLGGATAPTDAAGRNDGAGLGATGAGASASASSSGGPVQQTGNAASSLSVVGSTTLLGMVFSFFLL